MQPTETTQTIQTTRLQNSLNTDTPIETLDIDEIFICPDEHSLSHLEMFPKQKSLYCTQTNTCKLCKLKNRVPGPFYSTIHEPREFTPKCGAGAIFITKNRNAHGNITQQYSILLGQSTHREHMESVCGRLQENCHTYTAAAECYEEFGFDIPPDKFHQTSVIICEGTPLFLFELKEFDESCVYRMNMLAETRRYSELPECYKEFDFYETFPLSQPFNKISTSKFVKTYISKTIHALYTIKQNQDEYVEQDEDSSSTSSCSPLVLAPLPSHSAPPLPVSTTPLPLISYPINVPKPISNSVWKDTNNKPLWNKKLCTLYEGQMYFAIVVLNRYKNPFTSRTKENIASNVSKRTTQSSHINYKLLVTTDKREEDLYHVHSQYVSGNIYTIADIFTQYLRDLQSFVQFDRATYIPTIDIEHIHLKTYREFNIRVACLFVEESMFKHFAELDKIRLISIDFNGSSVRDNYNRYMSLASIDSSTYTICRYVIPLLK